MSSHLKYWYLHDHRLFRNLSFSEINSLCILRRYKKSKKSEAVELPDNDSKHIYLLKNGTLKLIKFSEEGEEILLDIIHKGDIFGAFSLEESPLEDQYFKVVSDEAILCSFQKKRLEEIMQKRPDFALSYIKFIGFKYRKLQNSYKNILFKDARTRLLLFVHSLLENEGIKQGSFTFPNYLTQKDISQLICTTRQTVVSLINDLEKEGVLSYSQKEITITEVEQLLKLVHKVK